jgi:hypothetical protein
MISAEAPSRVWTEGERLKTIILIPVLLVVPLAAWSQQPTRPEILVLGTYHMANPGRDLHNMQADDPLSPRRQKEIDALVEVLKRFRPTKVAVEADVGSEVVTKRYSDYVAGKYALTRNETEQIGFRLAMELGHTTISPVDEEGDFPYERVQNFAKANGRAEEFAALATGAESHVQEQDKFLASHTVLEMLERMNADATVAGDVAMYLAFVPFGDPGDYAGPDLLAAWYQRNIRIYHNIRALVTGPNDRILVLYGAGHLGWLRQDIANDASVSLRKLGDLTSHP